MNKSLLSILLLVLCGFVQHSEVVIHQSDIINVQSLNSFYAALGAIVRDSNTVSVIHIGDSHIKADILSGTVRKRLQNTFGNAGRGFVFPYEIAKSDGALDVQFSHTGTWHYCHIKKGYSECNLGVAGFTVVPAENASFSIDVETNAAFNKVTLFTNHGSFSPVQANGNFYPVKENKHTVIYFDELQEILAFKPAYMEDTLPELQGMVLENSHPGVLYHTMGINGSTVSQYLRSKHFEEQINMLDASLVIISFGTNDSYTPSSKFCVRCLKEEYRTLINRVRDKSPKVSILLTIPPDHYLYRRYPSNNVAPLRDAMTELTAEEDVAVWDLYQAMGGKNAIMDWKKGALARADLVHFTFEGYGLQGEMLYNALMRGYQSQ
jgi:lysophospholipase L1-like esterase